jgi:uncharacterized membrane protein YdjX (TVP38/TMEM64 family)
MIPNQAALTNSMPTTEPATGSSVGKILIALVIAGAIGAFFYFDVAYIPVTGLSLPGAVILTLAGGFLFGRVYGALFVNIGAMLAFLAKRYLLRDWVEQKFGNTLGPIPA